MLPLTRHCLLEELNETNGTGTILRGFLYFSLKFSTLNELEDLGTVVDGDMSAKDWPEKWCNDSNMLLEERYSKFPFSSVEFAMASQETALTI